MINGNEITGVLVKGVMMNIMFREAMIKFLIVLLLPPGLFCVMVWAIIKRACGQDLHWHRFGIHIDVTWK